MRSPKILIIGIFINSCFGVKTKWKAFLSQGNTGRPQKALRLCQASTNHLVIYITGLKEDFTCINIANTMMDLLGKSKDI